MKQIIFLFSVLFILSCKKNNEIFDEKDHATSNSIVYGCTDTNALNYNSNANTDEGCIYETDITEEQKALGIYFTSTGCPSCGSFGTASFENIVTTNTPNVIPMAIHVKYGDPYIIDESDEFADIVGYTFITPYYFIGEDDIMAISGGGINLQQTYNNAANRVNTIINEEPDVNATSKLVFQDGQLRVYYSSKFFKSVSGDYSLALYLLEDETAYPQASGSGNPYYHQYVLRAAINGTVGESIVENGSNAGQNFIGSKTLDVPENWDGNNMYALAVIWKDGNKVINVSKSLENSYK